ncbi:MAG: sodium:proton antiporter NhaD [Prevotellaceae bacterium]|jgi:Na+/H+ antiporter NhaD/arsenite permease-like protein|nr:sodium:proton antiporter NhaD [Prevotellaceae bacterium]
MFYVMIAVFVLGYVMIALEHPLRVNKSASALLLGVILWTLFALCNPLALPDYSPARAYLEANEGSTFIEWVTHVALIHHLGEISEILFFLLGAMTIVELIDCHGGFGIITNRIRATRKTPLLWIISVIAFFMSAVLDNLTTSIVMVALLRKLVSDRKDRWIFSGMVIIAANAGGAWSPIGDVTTIMLWIGNKISALNIISAIFVPSFVSLIVPLGILSFTMKGRITRPEGENEHQHANLKMWERNLIFFMGVGLLLCVPVFKTITHLPPYLGVLGGLSILWITTELMNARRSEQDAVSLSVSTMLRRIDTSSVLFFLGILVAVASLQACGQLMMLSMELDTIPLGSPSKYYLITVIMGLLSAVVDNVPLVAGAMGMYSFPMDHFFWEFTAYAAGTGGSILIIGSAAGVAVMGMEKIDFIWYLKRISLLALVGYLAGCGVFILERAI